MRKFGAIFIRARPGLKKEEKIVPVSAKNKREAAEKTRRMRGKPALRDWEFKGVRKA